ncbi:MAG: SGNH/GDSL hydrolase family protein [Prevotellaceae bacterium]|nr:SGNH/GDSL hydrolase family protein [Prevotellaceae bacterium]
MRRKLFLWLLLISPSVLMAQRSSELIYHDAKAFRIMGRSVAEPAMVHTDSMAYTRLPWSQKEDFRSELWGLGLHSAGIAVRFRSNSRAIGARWIVRSGFGMNHMAATGVRGVDLYVLNDDGWRYVGTGIPATGKENEKMLILEMDGAEKEFMLHLPLYDGVVKLEIGIDSTANIYTPLSPLPLAEKPIVCYGTSITQGGCATRPGMAYPAIMARSLQREVINLGFSGNGRMDSSIGALMAKIDAGAYFVDCLGNCTVEMIEQLGYDFMCALLQARPDTPVYMVENHLFPAIAFNLTEAQTIAKKNATWRDIYELLRCKGFENLFYVPADKLTGSDAEATVDGVHLTDLGFLRMAKVLSDLLY